MRREYFLGKRRKQTMFLTPDLPRRKCYVQPKERLAYTFAKSTLATYGLMKTIQKLKPSLDSIPNVSRH